jgi:hypothetical protein
MTLHNVYSHPDTYIKRHASAAVPMSPQFFQYWVLRILHKKVGYNSMAFVCTMSVNKASAFHIRFQACMMRTAITFSTCVALPTIVAVDIPY